jgi:hypothetical protein
LIIGRSFTPHQTVHCEKTGGFFHRKHSVGAGSNLEPRGTRLFFAEYVHLRCAGVRLKLTVDN